MSSTTLAMRDSMTMLRRNLLHAKRYPNMTLSVAFIPIFMLLLFVYVFGGAIGKGLATGDYVNFVTPGILMMATMSGSVVVAVSVSVDKTEGIINRFRTMPISRASVMTGQVVGSVIQTMISVVLVTLVALLIGFRPAAGPLGWLGVIGLMLLVAFAITWISAAFGLIAKGAETASNIGLPFQFLPFLGNAIVTPESMPAGLRWFAEYQPFTPIIGTLRALLMGQPVGGQGLVAIAWCLAGAFAGYFWARSAFNRRADS
ncbi:ABC transporter permease [Nonomuraea endophytica]|uniref:Transport permease protein n=1 Tax=Nonomuraea endophytica TaxID=714136 RepID=A0A7W8AF82_9ACTN|nr:ABC transporter permease [Nonomuraea endophytica]MBB5085231.1 ABC-2 type transport system permease protein [Nonomuraea endophytica]